VPAGEAEALNAAITSVWASLYSRRAVLSRRAAGVSQGDACMAVLIMVRGWVGESEYQSQYLLGAEIASVLTSHSKQLRGRSWYNPGACTTLSSLGKALLPWSHAVAQCYVQLK
jgi:hypothetical protein